MRKIESWDSFNEGLSDISKHIKYVRNVKKKAKEILEYIEKEKVNIIFLKKEEDNWKFSHDDYTKHYNFKFEINEDVYEFDYDRKETDVLSEFSINGKEYFLSKRNANRLLKILKSIL